MSWKITPKGAVQKTGSTSVIGRIKYLICLLFPNKIGRSGISDIIKMTRNGLLPIVGQL